MDWLKKLLYKWGWIQSYVTKDNHLIMRLNKNRPTHWSGTVYVDFTTRRKLKWLK